MLTKPLEFTAWPPQPERGSGCPLRQGALQGPPRVLAVVMAMFAVALPSLLAQAPSQSQPQAGAALPAGYVGSDVCAGCHEEIVKNFQKNPHAEIGAVRKKWEGMACESCHGPGAKHAESTDPKDIINPEKVKPAKASGICLECHKTADMMSGWVSSKHSLNQVTCANCHKIHQGRERLVPRTGAAVNRTCARCHTAVLAEFARPYKHPVPSGAMSCADCHNPHGTLNARREVRLVNGNEPVCLNCHVNIRGPFVFEHPPVKTEGCQTCHMPHGSAYPRMLNYPRVDQLCLQCHAAIAVPLREPVQPTGPTKVQVLGGIPPAFHNLANPRFRNCNVCHIKVHGSNVDPTLER